MVNTLKKIVALTLALCLWMMSTLVAFATDAVQGESNTEPVVEEPVVEEPVVEEPVVEEPVVEESVVEEPIVEEPVVEEPVVEESIVEEPVVEESIVEESIVEEPVVEESIVEEPVVEEPVVEESVVEESIVEEPVVEEPVIDTTKAASHSPEFTQGYAVTMRDTALYKDADLADKLGIIDANSVVYVKSRSDNSLKVSADTTDGGSLKGFVSAEDVRPLSDEESATYQSNALPAGYTPKESAEPVEDNVLGVSENEALTGEEPVTELPSQEESTEPVEDDAPSVSENEALTGEEPVTELPSQEESTEPVEDNAPSVSENEALTGEEPVTELPSQEESTEPVEDNALGVSENEALTGEEPVTETPSQELAITIKAVDLYSDSALQTVQGNIAADSVVTVLNRDGESAEVTLDTENGSVTGFVAASALRSLTPEEVAAYSNAAPMTMEAAMPALLYLPGATTLTAGVSTELTLSTLTGTAGNVYASFAMPSAGLMTLTFKSVGIATGNLTLKVSDANDSTELWSDSLVPTGTTNFSMFVESGSYDIIIGKSDPSDASSYKVSITPIISLAGELGTRNNTQYNAATLPINGGTASTGIYSMQDLLKGREDYYKITLDSAGNITISATNLSTDSLNVYVYGDDTSTGNEITSMSIPVQAAGEDRAITVHQTGWLASGTYYIMVLGDAAGRYRLQTALTTVALTEKEPNNTLGQAYASGNTLALNNSTYVNALLSESDIKDYYVFHTNSAIKISASVKAQMPDIKLYICDQAGDKVPNSDFGGIGGGSYGNPCEYELKELLLPRGGYYYLCAEKNAVNGATGLYSVRIGSQMTIGGVTATVSGKDGNQNIITVKATATPGARPITLHRWNLYYINGGQTTLVTCRESKNAGDQVFSVNRAGSYIIQYVCTDGINWADGFSSIVTATVKPFVIESVSATPNNTNGQIVCTAKVTGYTALANVVFSLYRNGVIVERYSSTNQLTHTFAAPVSGQYSVQCAVSDGVLYLDGWTVCNVTVPLPLEVSRLNASGDSQGKITVNATTQNGYPLVQGYYHLYLGNTRISSFSTTALQQVFNVKKAGMYTIQYVAYDGKTWVDKWVTCEITMSAKPLTVSSLTVTANNQGSISCEASTANGGTLTNSIFHLYRNSVLLQTISNPNQKATFVVAQDGNYAVQYVASDGKTYADKWSTVSVTLDPALKLEITSLTATVDQSSGKISCIATVGGKRPIQQVLFHLYKNNKRINTASSGTLLSATFYAPSNGNYTIQAVVADTVTVVDKWTTANVTGLNPMPIALEVTSVKAVNNNGNLTCTATTNIATPLVSSIFRLYKGSIEIASRTAQNKTATFVGIADGTYSVQFVAYDGSTWADGWTSVKVNPTMASISGLSAIRDASGKITCSCTVTPQAQVAQAMYHAYQGNTKIATWTWSGTGTPVSHTFNFGVDASKVTAIQYVIYDGTWHDAWVAVTP